MLYHIDVKRVTLYLAQILWVRALQLTQQALGAWPCQELDIEGSVDLRMLAKLPDPTSCSTVPLIRCSNITVSELTQVRGKHNRMNAHVAYSPNTAYGSASTVQLPTR